MDAVISADGVLRFENNAHTQLAPPSPPPSPPLGAAPSDFDLDSDDSEEDFGPPPSPPCPEEEIPTPDPVEEKATQEEMQVCTQYLAVHDAHRKTYIFKVSISSLICLIEKTREPA